MVDSEAKVFPNPGMNMKKISQALQIGLRILTIACTLIASCLMFTSKQSIFLYNTPLDARYSYSSTLKFFASANLVACTCCTLTLLCILFLNSKGSSSAKLSFYLFLHDMLMTCLLLAGCSSAAALGVLAEYGNSHIGWMAICDNFTKFCNRVMASVALSFLSCFCLLLLAIVSANASRQMAI